MKNTVQCWLGPKIDDKYQPAMVFEPNSLGPGLPTSRLAIDPKHPMSLPSEYCLKGKNALRPSIKFQKLDQSIQKLHWGEVESLLPGENLRYDLVLSDDSCGAYLANGIVIKARDTVNTPGYKYF